MDIYKIYQRLGLLRSGRLKLVALLFAHLFRRRVIGIFFDPVMACNLRCQMCSFSDPEKSRTYKGMIDDTFIDKLDKSLFHRTLKFQIGCAAEPTLYPRLTDLIKAAKKSNVGYISITTNGQILTIDKLREYIEAGLNEVTLSMHGTEKAIYENLMVNAKFDKLINLAASIKQLKDEGLKFRLRVNYTVNADNIDGLSKFFEIFEGNTVDILQIRPVQRLGNTAYSNFDLTDVKAKYDDIIIPLLNECKRRKISCLVPSKEEIDAVGEGRTSAEKLFEELTYCYINSSACYVNGFDLNVDTYESYHRRNNTSKKLIKAIFSRNSTDTKFSNNTTKKLNYKLK